MEFARTGIILNTEHFDDCVAFYRDLFDLPVLFSKTEGDFRLCCLSFGGSYLMIESEGVANPAGKSIEQNATKLRFNVDDLDAMLARLRLFDIEAEIVRSAWGSTINIHDPDGNRVGIRDEAGFVEQLHGKR
ncbi:glyoxalase [Marinobacterium nitratireducens]|uniref:Glyoxalase n=1 Tax=Marinobacterium nitratireducens TaxID=518897 RepID=A0A918DPQ9_9GAMM|nr:VOC family protein [Marinobacterium nitratireducens]GGO78665.1 glyoxalase [Marinobacterium nitratireducens]